MISYENFNHLEDKDRLAFVKKHSFNLLAISKCIHRIINSYDHEDTAVKPLCFELETMIDLTTARACRRRHSKDNNKLRDEKLKAMKEGDMFKIIDDGVKNMVENSAVISPNRR